MVKAFGLPEKKLGLMESSTTHSLFTYFT